VDGTPADNDSPLRRFLREGGWQDGVRGEMHGELQPVGQNWLNNPQMLKSAMPTARTMEFAYTQEGSKPQNFPKAAADLLEVLSTHRTSCPKRPILFIAHRAGGVILQKALVLDRAPEVGLRPRFEEYEFPDHIFDNISQLHQLSVSTQPLPTNITSRVNDDNLQQAKRSSEVLTSNAPPISHRPEVRPVPKLEILNVIIGTVFLESQLRSKDDRVTHALFMDTIGELGIPVRWYSRKNERLSIPPPHKVNIPSKNTER
jgi:hypothetical protein